MCTKGSCIVVLNDECIPMHYRWAQVTTISSVTSSLFRVVVDWAQNTNQLIKCSRTQWQSPGRCGVLCFQSLWSLPKPWHFHLHSGPLRSWLETGKAHCTLGIEASSWVVCQWWCKILLLCQVCRVCGAWQLMWIFIATRQKQSMHGIELILFLMPDQSEQVRGELFQPQIETWKNCSSQGLYV